jgi:hypothetical protein
MARNAGTAVNASPRPNARKINTALSVVREG